MLEDDIRQPLLAGRLRQTLPPIGSPYCYLTNFGGAYGNDVVAAHAMNPRSWSWFLNELQDGDGDGAHLAGGFMEQHTHAPTGPWIGWPDLHVTASTSGPVIAQVKQAVRAFLHQAATAADPTYGEISLQPVSTPGGSLLGRSLNHLPVRDRERNGRVHPATSSRATPG